MDDDPRGAKPALPALAEVDQRAADTDQTGADVDQTGADLDQGASELDQRASDRDQAAADRDQAHVDELSAASDAQEYASTRRDRAQSGIDRDRSTQARSVGAQARDAVAEHRDRVAAGRDEVATARDQLAAELDAAVEHLEAGRSPAAGHEDVGLSILIRGANDRRQAASSRVRAARHRDAAALDRALAAEDREHAAQDRRAAATELALEGVDHLTGALRRRVGLAAIQRELGRSDRSREPLTLVFLDVNGLKLINDGHGHLAGDEVLRAVVRCIAEQLRSSDLIVRFGGDEFLIVLPGQDTGTARRRFRDISARLKGADHCPTFTVGFAESGHSEPLTNLIARADGSPTRASAPAGPGPPPPRAGRATAHAHRNGP